MSANTDFVLSVVNNLSGTMYGNYGWGNDTLQLIVDDAIEAYGVTAEADATDSAKLISLLRYFTWSRVRDSILLEPVAHKTDGESFQWDMGLLNKKLLEEYTRASQYLPEGSDLDQDYIDLGFSPYKRST
jgi:hypothetical protein